MNIECGTEVMKELENAFRFNDAVIRNLILTMDEAVTEPSPMAKSKDEKEERRHSFDSDAPDMEEAGAE
jgi:small subunit ribosomal protein S6